MQWAKELVKLYAWFRDLDIVVMVVKGGSGDLVVLNFNVGGKGGSGNGGNGGDNSPGETWHRYGETYQQRLRLIL